MSTEGKVLTGQNQTPESSDLLQKLYSSLQNLAVREQFTHPHSPTPNIVMPLIVSSHEQLYSSATANKPASTTSCLLHVSPTTFFHDKAHNGVVSRLLGCLVNEHLAEAHLLETSALPPNLSAAASSRGRAPAFSYWLCISSPAAIGENNTFWVPLRNVPLGALPADDEEDCSKLANGRSPRVRLLDPEDLGFPVLETTATGNVVAVPGARRIMEQLGRWHPDIADKATMELVTQEMENSALHQKTAYLRCLQERLPPLELATASAIEWEHSIIEGHATHPMHKSRFAVPPTLPICPDKDLRFPTIHFFAVSRSLVTIRGPFNELISPLLHGCTDAIDWRNETVVPVHELQLPNVHAKFPQARQLTFTQPARAQVSLRTVIIEALPHLNLKLSLGVKVSSCMRTISPWSTHIGPSFTPIAERLIENQELLQLCNELASVVIADADPEYARHFSCIIRQDAQSLAEPRGELVIVCAALAEKACSLQEGAESVVSSILRLNTQEQRSRFFGHYARRFLQAFLPPLYKHGVSFEAHLQNVLARFRRKCGGDPVADDGCTDWELVGFTVRDLGGIKVHQTTLRKTTGGLQVEVWNEEASVIARDVEEVHDVAFHTMFPILLSAHLSPKMAPLIKSRETDLLFANNQVTRAVCEEHNANLTIGCNSIEKHILRYSLME
ncbi:hypothetical protein GOP47_0022807 [Adiantum capillus-veneris]|uniref:Aerobactin siderophore biosynthesis IucA/IucC N-terminal domain-containing protein n=1 Tax=Adiantum capillus-veneris TaxID=13818 RepID=A0A9D4U767_ADICA|nr:hypothetical protein GOP47_0022807 [Adiantum capillus-veneris]